MPAPAPTPRARLPLPLRRGTTAIEPRPPAALDLLLVEDNPADARLVREAVADAAGRLGSGVGVGGVRIRQASGLSEALRLLGEATPGAVLLDLVLGDSVGMATLERVVAAAPGVPVVVLTGLDERDVAEEALRRGAEDYVAKADLSPALLSRVLRYAVARAHAARAAQQRQRLEGALLVARTVAHEINNSLAPVTGYAELLAIHPEVARIPQVVTYAERIRDSALEVAAKVQRLQRIVRLEEQSSPPGRDQPLLDLERSTAG
jgi:CheY-like chemotaxis protein